MQDHILTGSHIVLFQQHLKQEDREQSTIEKYLRDLRLFAIWLAGRVVTAEIAADWKNHLRAEGYKSETINSKLSSLNKFFMFIHNDGSYSGGVCGHCIERENTNHPAAPEALPKTAKVRQEAKNHFWRDLSHQKRKRHLPPSDLGGDEGVMQKSRCGCHKSFPPQSAALVCQNILPCLPGCGEAGGRAGTLQY